MVAAIALLASACGSRAQKAVDETTTTTTTIAPLTVAEVSQLMPKPTEVPTGWSVSDSAISTEFIGGEIDENGICAGPALDWIAQSKSALGKASIAVNPAMAGESARFKALAFPSPLEASSFMESAAAAATACPSGVIIELEVRSASGRTAMAPTTITASVNPSKVEGANESFALVEKRITELSNPSGRFEEQSVTMLARFGDIVFALGEVGDTARSGGVTQKSEYFQPSIQKLVTSIRGFALPGLGRVGARPGQDANQPAPNSTTTTSTGALVSCKRTWDLWKTKLLSDKPSFMTGWSLSTLDCSRAEWISEATKFIEASRAGDKLGGEFYLRWAMSGAGGKTAEEYLNEACAEPSFATQGFPLGRACLP